MVSSFKKAAVLLSAVCEGKLRRRGAKKLMRPRLLDSIRQHITEHSQRRRLDGVNVGDTRHRMRSASSCKCTRPGELVAAPGCLSCVDFKKARDFSLHAGRSSSDDSTLQTVTLIKNAAASYSLRYDGEA